jgi:hypothetical protein
MTAEGCERRVVRVGDAAVQHDISRGRLTLNVLLSLALAQVEREVTGERIRDKIAASSDT